MVVCVGLCAQKSLSVETLTPDATNSGAISSPSQQVRFVFSGSQGQRLYFDSLQLDQYRLRVQLVSPAEAVVFESSLNYEPAPLYLPQTGTYTLIIDGEADATGPYAFRILDIATQPTIALNSTNSITISPSSLSVVRKFAGVAGQTVELVSMAYSSTDAEWLLIDPANQIVTQRGVDADLGTNLLRVSGTYLVVIRGTAQDGLPLNFQFVIRDVSQAPVAASGFNIVRSGSINPGQTNTFAFTAPAGTPAYYDALTTEGQSDIGLEIAAPNGEIIVSKNSGYNGWDNATFDSGPFVLPQSGTYTLRIIGNSGGYYRFRLLNLWSNSVPISFGTTNSGSFGETNGTVVYKVDVSPAQPLFYDSLVGWRPNTDVKLWRASSLSGFDRSESDTYNFWFTAVSPETVYVILSAHNDDPSTTYRFRIISLDHAPTLSITIDSTITNLLSDPYAAHVYKVNLSTGQRLFWNFSSENPGAGQWELYDPQVNRVEWGYLNSDFVMERAKTGTYALVVSPELSDDPPNLGYSFQIATITSTTNALVFGATYSNSISSVGQEHMYTFAGTVGMRIYYDALQNTEAQISVRLIAPNGYAVWGATDADADSSNPITLDQTGTYTLVFGGLTDAIGTYAFRLIDVSQPPAAALSLNTIIRGTNNPYFAAVFRVPLVAGKQLFCDSRLASYSGWWALYDVGNGQIAGNNLAFDFEPTPGQTGTGVLVVGNSSADPCPYEFRVLDPTRVTNTIAVGTLVSNYLADAGDEHYLTFYATAGQRIYFDARNQYANDVWVYMETLDRSSWIWNVGLDWDAGLSTIPVSGLYTLRIHNSSDAHANYRFAILDLAAQPALIIGTPISAQLNPGTQTHIYRIGATAGQKIYFKTISASASEANWLIQDQFNNQIAYANIQTDLGLVFFPVTGTYALIIQGYGPESETLTYQILATNVAESTMPPAGFGFISGYVDPGQTNYAYFNAAAGTPVYIDSLTNNYSATLRIRDTNGMVILETPPGGASRGVPDPGLCILPSSGTYTVEIEAYNGGDYAFRILNLLTDAPSLTTGAPYTAAFTNGFQTDVYRLNVLSQQLLYYDALTNGNEVYLCLLQPDGRALLGNIENYWSASAYADQGPVRVSGTNTYYLVLMNATEQTPSYNFRVLDPAASTRIVLGQNYTNSVPPFESVFLHFTNIPTALFFDALVPNWTVMWGFIRAGSVQVANWSWDDFESSSFMPGTNFIVLQNNTQDTQSWPFRILVPIPITNTLTLGTVYSDSLTPGQEHWYTFDATVPQRVYFDSLVPFHSVSLWVVAKVYAPSGNELWTSYYFNDSFPPLLLTEPGTYRICLHNYSDQLVQYSFRILDVAAQPAISLDVTNSCIVTPGTAARLFRFYPTNQARLYIDSLDTEWVNADWLVFDSANQQLGGNAIAGDIELTSGNLSGELLLILSGYTTNQYSHTFRIVPGNHAPTITSPTIATVDELTTLNFTNTVFDPEAPNDQITFALSGSVPAGMAINPFTGIITWTPSEIQGPATNTVVLIASDDGIPPLSSIATLTIIVNEVNQPPILTVPTNQLINELTQMSVSVFASDPDIPTNTLTFALVSAPAGATINPATGLITWTPSEAQGPSTNLFIVKVTDSNALALVNKQLSATNSFTVIVNEVNSAPSLPTQTNRTINELTQLIVTNTATDADLPANTLSYQLINPPAGAIISTNGIISWTPTEIQGPGVYTLTTVVTDNGTPPLSATNSFTVTVNEVNSAPSLPTQTNRTINELTQLIVTNTATDADLPANTLSYQLINPPAGATISTNGIISWTPTEIQGPGVYTLTTVVTDNGTPPLSATNMFTVVVNEVNSAPVLTLPANQIVHAGTYVSLQATATDPDLPPNTLSFALINGPAGLTVGTEGLISWQTSDAYAGTTNIVTVRVTDNGTPPLSSTNSFLITVLSRPVITSITRSNECVTVTWTAIPGTIYRLQYKTNLTDSTWLNVPGDVQANGPAASKTDNPSPARTRFYRVLAP